MGVFGSPSVNNCTKSKQETLFSGVWIGCPHHCPPFVPFQAETKTCWRPCGFRSVSCELIPFRPKPTSHPTEGQACLGTEAAFLSGLFCSLGGWGWLSSIRLLHHFLFRLENPGRQRLQPQWKVIELLFGRPRQRSPRWARPSLKNGVAAFGQALIGAEKPSAACRAVSI